MLAVSPNTQPEPAPHPTAEILDFPADRARPPAGHRAIVSDAMAGLSRAVEAYATTVRAQQAAIAEFMAATEAMHRVANQIVDTNGGVQQTITRILGEARLLRLKAEG